MSQSVFSDPKPGRTMSNSEHQREPPEIAGGGFERLKLLFDYTKFHIGLYTTLVTLLIALISLGSEELVFIQHIALAATTVCFVLAGACGGVIASNIPYFATLGEFQRTGFGPRWLWSKKQATAANLPNPGFAMFPILKGPTWASLEHLFFWLGILIALAGTGWSLFASGAPAPRAFDCNPIYLECRP